MLIMYLVFRIGLSRLMLYKFLWKIITSLVVTTLWWYGLWCPIFRAVTTYRHVVCIDVGADEVTFTKRLQSHGRLQICMQTSMSPHLLIGSNDNRPIAYYTFSLFSSPPGQSTWMFTESLIKEWSGRVFWYAIWRHYTIGLLHHFYPHLVLSLPRCNLLPKGIARKAIQFSPPFNSSFLAKVTNTLCPQGCSTCGCGSKKKKKDIEPSLSCVTKGFKLAIFR